MKITHFLSLVLGLALSIPTFAQEPSEAPVCNEEFAKFLVDQQVTEGRGVPETGKRVRILLRSGDFLWKFDEPKAREYLSEAFKVATDHFGEKGFERKEYPGGGIYEQLPDYRFEVLKTITKHDAAWARKLTEELIAEYEKTKKDRNPMDRDREVGSLLSIALENVKANPAISLYIYRRLMRMDLEYQWFWTLFSVHGKEPAFANILYGELLTSHANATPRRVIYLSAYPFGRPRMIGYEGNSFVANVSDFTPNVQLQSRFIDLLLRRADAYVSDPANYNVTPEEYRQEEAVYIVGALAELEPAVIESFPAYLPRLNAVRAKANGMLSAKGRKALDDREKLKTATVKSFEERITELEKADDEGKLTDAMILQVLISGLKSEEQFKQLETWIDKITDSEGRAGSTNYFWFIRSQLAIKEKRFADAQKFAAKVPEVEHQAILWFEIADKQLEDINDSANAYQTLRDVAVVARKAEDSVGKARVHLGLANLYEKLNHSFAISELSDAVGVINKIKDADLESSYLMRHIKVKDMSFGASLSAPGYDLEKTFTTVSKDDFSLPLSNAKTLEDRYYRTIAVIAIAKNCINKPKPKRNR